MLITDFTERGTAFRRAYNTRIQQITLYPLDSGPKTVPELSLKTGLSNKATELALNLLHTHSKVRRVGEHWYKTSGRAEPDKQPHP